MMQRKGTRRFALGAVLVLGALAAWSPGLSAGESMAPKLGRSFELTRVSGTVLVTVPGGHASALKGTRLAPVGSTIHASRGVVRVTASNGRGGTYSGQFSKGAFKALQSSTGSSSTEIKLVGKLCPPPRVGAYHHHGHRFFRASGANFHRHGHRYLRASVSPDFLVVGANGSAQSAGGVATLTLSDTCTGAAASAAGQANGETRVVDHSGHLRARSANHRLLDPISPGQIDQLRCSQSGGYCVRDIVRLKGVLRGFFFPAVATTGREGKFELCVRGPSKRRSCKAVVSNGPVFEDGSVFAGGLSAVACQAHRIGSYAVSWRLRGVQLGPPLTFHLASLPKHGLAFPCEAFLGNFDAVPQRTKLPANIKAVSRLTLPLGVHITSMSVDLAPTGVPGHEWVRGVIYADKDGAPGGLRAVTKAFRFTSGMPADSSYQLAFAAGNTPNLAPGKYWLGVISGGDDDVATIGADRLPKSGAENVNSFAAGPSDPFGPSQAEDDYLAVNAAYIPHSR